jgi:protein SCO1/2
MSSRHRFIAIVAGVAIATGAWLSYQVMTPPATPKTATLLPAPGTLPEFSLLDHNGNAIGRDVFSGHWSLVFFGFTHCPDICPLTLQVLADARKQLSETGIDKLPQIVLVSVDPERDTPELLGQYVSYFGDDNLGITGDLEEIRKLTGGLGVFFEKAAVDGENYSVDHSAVVLVFNPRGQFHALFSAPHLADNFVHDMPLIMRGR